METKLVSQGLQRDIIVERLMPEFVEMCQNPGDRKTILMSSAAFGENAHEVELLGLAIKYATARGLSVEIIPHESK